MKDNRALIYFDTESTLCVPTPKEIRRLRRVYTDLGWVSVRLRAHAAVEGSSMPGYTPLGVEKILKQAKYNLELVRCPRDSVVMRVLGGRMERRDGSGAMQRFSDRLPSVRYWTVREVDLECPACRRRAQGIVVRPATLPTNGNAHMASVVAHHV